MRRNFERALDWIMNDGAGPPDQRSYDAYRHVYGQPLRSVSQADPHEVAHIYERLWNAGCAALPAGLDYLVFDRLVFVGRYVAVTLLWSAVDLQGDDENDPRLWDLIDDRSPADMVHAYTRARMDLDRAVLAANKAILGLTDDGGGMRAIAEQNAERNRGRALSLLEPDNPSGYSPED